MKIRIAAWQPTTLIDYPGRVAATLFTAGCNFRCPFCHNAELVVPERVAKLARLDVNRILDELGRRREFLDGVVLTGGEPTVQEDLIPFIARLRALGFLVKLDTNGARPDIVRRLLGSRSIDYIAVDVKGPPARYAEFAGVGGAVSDVEETVRLVVDSGLDYEFRTTVAPDLDEADLEAIAAWIGPARRYVFQQFHVPSDAGKSLLDPSWGRRTAMGEAALRRTWSSIGRQFEDGGVRA